MRNDWLKDRLKDLKKTQAGLSKVLGLPTPRVAEIVKGRRRIQSSEIPIIARFLDWPIEKVVGLISDVSGFTPNVVSEAAAIAPIKVVGEVQAGVFKDTLEYEPAEQFEMDIPTDPRFRRFRKAALRVRGPSMNRLYPEGSIIVIVSVIELGDSYEPRSGQRVVVQRTNDLGKTEATVKELQIDRDGQAWLWPRSDHPEFQQPWKVPDNWHGTGDFDEHNDHLRITALVIGSYRPEE